MEYHSGNGFLQIRKSHGVTLSCLIIVIIVLLILAGVAIYSGVGNIGIIQRTESTTLEHQRSVEKEIISSVYSKLVLEDALRDNDAVNSDRMREEMNKQGLGKVDVVDEDGIWTITIRHPHRNVYILNVGTGEITYSDTYNSNDDADIRDGEDEEEKLTPIIECVAQNPNKEGYTKDSVIVTITAPVTLPDGYILQYSYTGNSSDWKPVEKNGTVEDSLVDVSEDGQKIVIKVTKNETIYARVRHVKSKVSYVSSENIENIDKQKPEGTLSVLQEKENGTASPESLTITVTANDPKTEDYASSGIQGYCYSKDGGKNYSDMIATNKYTFSGLTQKTEYNLYVKIIDKVGNETIISDKATTGKITATIEFGNSIIWNETTANRAKVLITGSQSGCELQYQINGTDADNWVTIASGSYTPEQPSGTIVYVRLWDGTNEGPNINPYGCITIKDDTAPTVSAIASSNSNWTNKDITITTSATDNESLVTHWDWAGTATTEQYGTGKGQRETGNQTKTISTNGTYYFTAKNGVGLSTTANITIENIDKDNPTVTFGTNGGTYIKPTSTSSNAVIKTTAKVSDTGGSGVYTETGKDDSLGYAWSTSNTTAPSSWTEFTNGAEISKTDVSEAGTWYLWIRYNDLARHNTGTTPITTVSSAFKVEGATISFSVENADTWLNGSKAVTISYSSNLTTNKKAGFGTTLDNAKNSATDTTPTSRTATTNGYVYAEATDPNGNKAYASIEITKIDTTSPTVTFGKNGGTFVKPTDNGATIGATVTVKDDESGVLASSLYYKWTTSSTAPSATASGWTAFTNGATISNTDCDVGTYYLHICYNNNARNNSGDDVIVTTSKEFNVIKPTITFGTASWSGTNATISVTGSQTGATLQYKIGPSGTWTDITSGSTVPNIQTGTTLYARLTDGTNSYQDSITPILTYNIEYDLDGGTYGTYHPTTANYNEEIEISNPTKDGYEFTGWIASSGLNTSTAKYGTSNTAVTTSWSSASTQVTEEYFKNLSSANDETVKLVANWEVEEEVIIDYAKGFEGYWYQNKCLVKNLDTNQDLIVGETVEVAFDPADRWYVLGAENGGLLVTRSVITDLTLEGKNGYAYGMNDLNYAAKYAMRSFGENTDFNPLGSYYVRSINVDDITRLIGYDTSQKSTKKQACSFKNDGNKIWYSGYGGSPTGESSETSFIYYDWVDDSEASIYGWSSYDNYAYDDVYWSGDDIEWKELQSGETTTLKNDYWFEGLEYLYSDSYDYYSTSNSGYYISREAYDLIFSYGATKSYWLATRGIDGFHNWGDGTAGYGLARNTGLVNLYELFLSNGTENTCTAGVRPVVWMNSSLKQ